eukprot:UN11027
MTQLIIWEVSDEVIIFLVMLVISILLCFIGILIQQPQKFCYVAFGMLAVALIIICVGLDQLGGSNTMTFRVWTLLILIICGVVGIILTIKHYAMIRIKAGRV